MATIFTHPVIAIGLSPYLDLAEKRKQIILIAVILTILPDIDVIGFRLGIPYLHLFGHRGFTHSIFFALVISFSTTWFIVKNTGINFLPVWIYLFLSAVSHGILDALTNGGYGIAFFSPFSNQRFFFPATPIDVSTLSIERFLYNKGYMVMVTELIWIWLPLLIIFVSGLLWKKRNK
ncbi:MAG: metal-dependent hydrolase [Gammaproteobacteria bacterium]|nr:metal-dependent hydrolase [Gammaproteobacteria bacterium]